MAARKPKVEKVEIEETKEVAKDTQPKGKPKTMKTIRKAVDKDLQVVVMNNTTGCLVYQCPKTNVLIDMSEYGDTEILTVDQLNTMKNKHRGILAKYWLVLIDVVSDDVTLDDVIAYLRLDEVYENMKDYDVDLFDRLLLNTHIDKFRAIVEGMQVELVKRMAERAIVLYKESTFDSRQKMLVLEEILDDKDLFNEE